VRLRGVNKNYTEILSTLKSLPEQKKPSQSLIGESLVLNVPYCCDEAASKPNEKSSNSVVDHVKKLFDPPGN
jgi:hypothetical protein